MKSGLGKKIGPDWMHKEETELDEGRMKELHGYIKQGKSAEWIAKKMKVDGKGKGASKNSAIAVRPSHILPRNRIHHNHK